MVLVQCESSEDHYYIDPGIAYHGISSRSLGAIAGSFMKCLMLLFARSGESARSAGKCVDHYGATRFGLWDRSAQNMLRAYVSTVTLKKT